MTRHPDSARHVGTAGMAGRLLAAAHIAQRPHGFQERRIRRRHVTDARASWSRERPTTLRLRGRAPAFKRPPVRVATAMVGRLSGSCDASGAGPLQTMEASAAWPRRRRVGDA